MATWALDRGEIADFEQEFRDVDSNGAVCRCRDCTSRSFSSLVVVRLRPFDDIPFLSDRKLRRFDRKQRRANLIWHKRHVLRYSVYAWLALVGGLKIANALNKLNIPADLACYLCPSHNGSINSISTATIKIKRTVFERICELKNSYKLLEML